MTYKNIILLVKSYEDCNPQQDMGGSRLTATDQVDITGVTAFGLLTSTGEMLAEAEGVTYDISYSAGRLRIRSLKSGRIVFTRKTEQLRLLV